MSAIYRSQYQSSGQADVMGREMAYNFAGYEHLQRKKGESQKAGLATKLTKIKRKAIKLINTLYLHLNLRDIKSRAAGGSTLGKTFELVKFEKEVLENMFSRGNKAIPVTDENLKERKKILENIYSSGDKIESAMQIIAWSSTDSFQSEIARIYGYNGKYTKESDETGSTYTIGVAALSGEGRERYLEAVHKALMDYRTALQNIDSEIMETKWVWSSKVQAEVASVNNVLKVFLDEWAEPLLQLEAEVSEFAKTKKAELES